jgi:hypothetical protein
MIELRNEIYAYHFEGHEDAKHPSARDPSCLQILLTCRQVSIEAKMLAWKNLKFTINTLRELDAKVLNKDMIESINLVEYRGVDMCLLHDDDLLKAGIQPTILVLSVFFKEDKKMRRQRPTRQLRTSIAQSTALGDTYGCNIANLNLKALIQSNPRLEKFSLMLPTPVSIGKTITLLVRSHATLALFLVLFDMLVSQNDPSDNWD